jgi:hypothetical protein
MAVEKYVIPVVNTDEDWMVLTGQKSLSRYVDQGPILLIPNNQVNLHQKRLYVFGLMSAFYIWLSFAQ